MCILYLVCDIVCDLGLNSDIEGQKIALFQYIAKNHRSIGITWSSIADALKDIHAGDLSLRIREKYCTTCRNDGEFFSN